MVSFYNYNSEKKNSSFADIYLMAFVAGILLVFLLIVSGYGVEFLIAFVIKYYLWVLGVLALIAIGTHYWNKGNSQRDHGHNYQEEACEYY